MKAELRCIAVESGVWPSGDAFTMATFMDTDVENVMKAFLKYTDDGAKKCEVGKVYTFGITGLDPVKNDRSSLYLKGGVVAK